MKALVTGGNGFIGTHLVDLLVAEGHTVRVLDRYPSRFRADRPEVEYLCGDLENLHEVEEAYGEIADKSIADEGIDISALLHQLLEPGLKSVDSVLMHNDTARFIPVYQSLVQHCNSCHRETKHEFIVIQMPEGNFNGQDFNVH